MTLYGWPGYEPVWVEEIDDFLALHRSQLKEIVGRRVTRFWFPWHPEWDERWVDGPFVIDFEGARLEFQGCRCLCSLSWNTLELDKPLGQGLVWVHQLSSHNFEEIAGQRLEGVTLLSFYSGDRMAGLKLVFESGDVLQLFDNGDETGIQIGGQLEGYFPVAFS